MRKPTKKSNVASSEITDETKQQLYASLFPVNLSKSQQRQVQIIEAAIECFASKGVDATTYDHISAKCGASRTLVIHYFPERDQMTLAVFKYIRAQMQQYSVNALNMATTPQAQLKLYVESVFDWSLAYPTHFKVWLLIYYYCGINPNFKTLHTELASMGHKRIQAMLKQIRSVTKSGSIEIDAKLIQFFITGAAVSINAENLRLSRKAVISQTVRRCLEIAENF